jgi:hypothetical protein
VKRFIARYSLKHVIANTVSHGMLRLPRKNSPALASRETKARRTSHDYTFRQQKAPEYAGTEGNWSDQEGEIPAILRIAEISLVP